MNFPECPSVAQGLRHGLAQPARHTAAERAHHGQPDGHPRAGRGRWPGALQQIQAAAGQAFAIEFDNQDQGILHNIDIKDASGTSVFKGDLVTGPAKTTYQVPLLAAGSYMFQCDVHPTMTGTVVVK